MEKWPNFFIVGAPKCGTTSLHNYLANIPDIYMSSLKEPYYFARNLVLKNHVVDPIWDKKLYLDLFTPAKDEKILGESSVWYLSDPDAAKLIHQQVPDARILISLRDPVERTFSHYAMFLSRYKITTSFHEQIESEINNTLDFDSPHIRLDAGLYSEDIKRYIEIFGKKQVKILIFEEWTLDPMNTVNEIIKFLEIDYSLSDSDLEAYNVYVETKLPRSSFAKKLMSSYKIGEISKRTIPKSSRTFIKEKFLKKKYEIPEMSDEDRDSLIKFFNDDVLKLQKLLNRKLPWKNFNS